MAPVRRQSAFAAIGDGHALRLSLAAEQLAECGLIDFPGVGCHSNGRALFDAMVRQGPARAFDR